jgi:hypothetical protein
MFWKRKDYFMFWKGKKETREKRNQRKPDRKKKKRGFYNDNHGKM